MKWIPATERLPENPKSRQRVSIKENGKPRTMVFIIGYGEPEGHWCWSMAFDDRKGQRISKEELDTIVWLDESEEQSLSTPISTNYYQVIEQTDEEKLKMYLTLPPEEVAKMLVNCNNIIHQLTTPIKVSTPIEANKPLVVEGGSAEEILDRMEEECPFQLSPQLRPYILEAMELYRNTPPSKAPVEVGAGYSVEDMIDFAEWTEREDFTLIFETGLWGQLGNPQNYTSRQVFNKFLNRNK